MPFREPLTPAPTPGQPLPPESERDPLAWHGRPDDVPYISVNEAGSPLSFVVGTPARLVQQIKATPRGLIIAGPQTDPDLARHLLQLAHQTGYPILADPLSQLRGTAYENRMVIASYDAFLRSEHFCSHHKPQLILRFGAMPVSKPVLLYLKRYPGCPQVVIDPHYGWEEPTQLATQVIYADPSLFCQQLGTELKQGDAAAREKENWTRAWQTADRVTHEALSAAINDLPDFFEGRIFTELGELLPAGSLVYAGNSMPVRDMDTFFYPRANEIHCLGNRGASGIDGVISSALGASAAGGPDEPAVLVIGDLSFYHDLNGLLAARLHRLDLTIVLVNNDGGGIFSFLPQAAYPEYFEQLFGTPIGLDFRPVVEMYGGNFQRVEDWDEFQKALKAGLAEGGLRVIEVRTERESNVTMHRQLWQVVERALTKAGLLEGSTE